MEFQDVGKRCSNPSCNTQDYLPIKCKDCQKYHCQPHANDHGCLQSRDKKVLQCPTCLKPITYYGNQDPNEVWVTHYNTNCLQQADYTKNAQSKKEITRCAKARCPTKLTDINKHSCRDCGQDFCLPHRFGFEHDCKSNEISHKPKNQTSKKTAKSSKPNAQNPNHKLKPGKEECKCVVF